MDGLSEALSSSLSGKEDSPLHHRGGRLYNNELNAASDPESPAALITKSPTGETGCCAARSDPFNRGWAESARSIPVRRMTGQTVKLFRVLRAMPDQRVQHRPYKRGDGVRRFFSFSFSFEAH